MSEQAIEVGMVVGSLTGGYETTVAEVSEDRVLYADGGWDYNTPRLWQYYRLVSPAPTHVVCCDEAMATGKHEGNVNCPPAPTAVDRTGCKAWCGLLVSDPLVPWLDGYGRVLDGDGGKPSGGARYDSQTGPHICWCSPACRDARVPPMTEKYGGDTIGTPVVDELPKSAEQPKPAVKGPVRCENANCDTPFQGVTRRWCIGIGAHGEKLPATLELSCEPCHLLDEADFAEKMMFEATGKPHKGPERIDRRLAHSHGLEDQALENA